MSRRNWCSEVYVFNVYHNGTKEKVYEELEEDDFYRKVDRWIEDNHENYLDDDEDYHYEIEVESGYYDE